MPTMGRQAKDSGGGFGAAQVDLPEGVRIQALLDGKQGDWAIGMRLRLTTRQVGTDEAGNSIGTIGFAPIGKGDNNA